MSPKPLRRSQVVSPFGVGAIVDFPGPVALIHAGLDAWPFDERKKDNEHDEFVINDEERLAERLHVQYFVKPPDYRYSSRGAAQLPNIGLKMPFLRFPRWHFCPRCGRMWESALSDIQAPVCRGPIGTGREKGSSHNPRKTLQVRFIAACLQGHLQDFPWWEWVFGSSAPVVRGHRLRMISSGAASVAGVRILCEEDNEKIHVVHSKTMSAAFNFKFGEQSSLDRIGVTCRGENPALHIPSLDFDAPSCGEQLYPMLKGSSNLYFAKEVRSIYVPPVDTTVSQDILEILENKKLWGFFTMIAPVNNNQVPVAYVKEALAKFCPESTISPDCLLEVVNQRLTGNANQNITEIESDTEETTFRRTEYNLFCSNFQEGYPQTNLLIRRQEVSDYLPNVQNLFANISLLHKLRETRVFTGFTRITPDNDQTRQQRLALISRAPKNWLPAVTVRGEGIFLVLKEEMISRWVASSGGLIDDRIGRIRKGLGDDHLHLSHDVIKINARFILLHTLSHLLINQLVYECGYGSASLRERIYYSDDENFPMAGILIYTAAGDSEGTMGGLVRMGKAGSLEPVLQRALSNARWCSTDPVCIESTGQGPENCNLAACHACALLPETSCEVQNRLLDRGLVVGTLESPDIGFFSQYI